VQRLNLKTHLGSSGRSRPRCNRNRTHRHRCRACDHYGCRTHGHGCGHHGRRTHGRHRCRTHGHHWCWALGYYHRIGHRCRVHDTWLGYGRCKTYADESQVRVVEFKWPWTQCIIRNLGPYWNIRENSPCNQESKEHTQDGLHLLRTKNFSTSDVVYASVEMGEHPGLYFESTLALYEPSTE
jgi:hypothetical protein